jgi:hypothetical protein
VVVATEAHRQGLFQKLQARGFDLEAIIESGCYTSIDVRETLSSFMVDDQPDPDKLGGMVSSLISTASKAPNGASRAVSACGECAPFLWSQGNLDAALRVEELWDAASRQYGLRTLCGYVSGNFQEQEDQRIFQRICSLHSIVTHYSRSAQLV